MRSFGLIKLDRPLKTGDTFSPGPSAMDNLKLWRPRPAMALTVVDAEGIVYRARITELDLKKNRAMLKAYERSGLLREKPRLTLLQAVPQKERMELIIEKATELGADAVCPFKSEKSISLEERDSLQRKSHKWQDVALKAAIQCRRPDITRVMEYRGFKNALDVCSQDELKILLFEGQGAKNLKTLLGKKSHPPASIAVMTGPEGGFTDVEIETAIKNGFVAARLTQNVLRTETASVAALSAIAYEFAIEA